MASKNKHPVQRPAQKPEAPKEETHVRAEDVKEEAQQLEARAEEHGAKIPEAEAVEIAKEEKEEEKANDRRGTFKRPQSRSVKAALHALLIASPGKSFTMKDFVEIISDDQRKATEVTIRTGLTDLKSKAWSKPFTPIEIAKSKKADGTETWTFVDRRKAEHSEPAQHSAEPETAKAEEQPKEPAPQQAHA